MGSNDKVNKKYKKAKYNEKLNCLKGGFTPIVHTNSAIKQTQCQIINILWKINKSVAMPSFHDAGQTNTFQQKIENAPYLEPGDTAKVLFEPNRRFAISISQKIVILEHKQLIMSGKVTKLHYADEIMENLK